MFNQNLFGNMANNMGFFGMPGMDMNNNMMLGMNMNNNMMPGMNMNNNMMPGMNMNMNNNMMSGMNMNMNMNNNMMSGMNMGGNEFWKAVYGDGFNMNQNMNQPDQVNVVFKSTSGLKMMVSVDVGTTVSNTLLLFLKRVGKPELFKPDSGIVFICNARKLNIYDNTKIENLLGGQLNYLIMVNDVKNLIGAKENIQYYLLI